MLVELDDIECADLILSLFLFSYSGQPWCGVADHLGPDKHFKDKDFLDKYALERWEV